MDLHTISAYETSAEEFFDKLANWNTDLVIDVRLHNTNQLAGFTKRRDLDFFVRTIQHARYVYDSFYTPDASSLERYLKGIIGWDEYASAYRKKMERQDAAANFLKSYGDARSIALVGTATHKRRSHVEVLKELIEDKLACS